MDYTLKIHQTEKDFLSQCGLDTKEAKLTNVELDILNNEVHYTLKTSEEFPEKTKLNLQNEVIQNIFEDLLKYSSLTSKDIEAAVLKSVDISSEKMEKEVRKVFCY